MKTAAYLLLLGLVLLSLALNALLLSRALAARQAVLQALDRSLKMLDNLADETFETSIRVEHTVPVDANVPFRRTLGVPLRLTVPISHTLSFQEVFQVPIQTPLFHLNVAVPVSATLPISLNVPVSADLSLPISETISFHTDVPIDLTVPVVVRLADTPLPAYLDQLRAALDEVRQELAPERK